MNKQEVLEELETTSTQFFHVATSTGVEANNKTLSTGVFAGLGIAKSVLTKLEEPQKVKVPKCVGELLDYYRNSTDVDLLALLICFKDWYFRKDKLNENEEAIDWLVKHPEKFMKAWLDGYEVEKEPKWVVKVDDNAYFVDFFDSLTPHLVDGLGWEVMRLDDKSKADAVALIIGGKAEKA
ncbi:DUF1642 domain-containing protein [Campylobacter jejuni]